jgi:hypothetical protein
VILKALQVLGQVLGVVSTAGDFLRERAAAKRASALPVERGHRIQSERYREASNGAGKTKDGETR